MGVILGLLTAVIDVAKWRRLDAAESTLAVQVLVVCGITIKIAGVATET